MNSYLRKKNYPFTIRSVSVSEDSLFVGTFRNTDLGEQDNCFRRLDHELRLVWKFPVKYSPLASALTPDFLLAVTWDIFSSGGFLYCLDRISGACVWNKRVKNISTAAELLVFGETLLCFCDSGVVGYQIKNGKRVMSANYSTNVYPPKVQNASVISCSRNSLVKFQGNDLRADWAIDGFDNPWGFGCDKDHVFVAKEGCLQIYDLKDGANVGRVNSGRCKSLSVICLSSLHQHPSGVRLRSARYARHRSTTPPRGGVGGKKDKLHK